jgi:hypothetical protein
MSAKRCLKKMNDEEFEAKNVQIACTVYELFRLFESIKDLRLIGFSYQLNSFYRLVLGMITTKKKEINRRILDLNAKSHMTTGELYKAKNILDEYSILLENPMFRKYLHVRELFQSFHLQLLGWINWRIFKLYKHEAIQRSQDLIKNPDFYAVGRGKYIKGSGGQPEIPRYIEDANYQASRLKFLKVKPNSDSQKSRRSESPSDAHDFSGFQASGRGQSPSEDFFSGGGGGSQASRRGQSPSEEIFSGGGGGSQASRRGQSPSEGFFSVGGGGSQASRRGQSPSDEFFSGGGGGSQASRRGQSPSEVFIFGGGGGSQASRRGQSPSEDFYNSEARDSGGHFQKFPSHETFSAGRKRGNS